MQIVALQSPLHFAFLDVLDLINLIQCGNLFIDLFQSLSFVRAQDSEGDLINSIDDVISLSLQCLDILIQYIVAVLARAAQSLNALNLVLVLDKLLFKGPIAHTLVEILLKVMLSLVG